MPLLPEKGFLPDFSMVSEKVLEQARLMFLNYPNNPTGAIATPELFGEAIELGHKHGICIVHDFAYGAIGYDGKKPLSFLQIPGAKEVGVEMFTLSKSYNMAGWRIGFVLGNRSVIRAIELIQEHYYCSIFGGLQQAAAHALLAQQDSVAKLVHMYEARRNRLVHSAREIAGKLLRRKGHFFCLVSGSTRLYFGRLCRFTA